LRDSRRIGITVDREGMMKRDDESKSVDTDKYDVGVIYLLPASDGVRPDVRPLLHILEDWHLSGLRGPKQAVCFKPRAEPSVHVQP